MTSIEPYTNSKRILVVTDNYPPDVGGISNVSHGFAKSLSEYHKVLIVAPKTEEKSPAIDDSSVAEISRTVHARRSGNDWRTGIHLTLLAMHLFKLARRFQPDVVLYLRTWPVVLTWPAVRILGIPYVVYCHGPIDLYASHPTKGLLSAKSLRKANSIIVNSRYTGSFLEVIRDLDRSKVIKIAPKIDLDPFSIKEDIDDFKKREGIESRRILVTVGTIQELKGQQQVIKTLPSLMERYPSLVYVIVGCGGYAGELEDLTAQLGLTDHVIFAGDRDVARFLQAADIVLVPSVARGGREESFGVVALEAAACGKPVIAGNTGGLREVVDHGKTGLLVDCEDLVELSKTIDRLLSDPVLAGRLGKEGLQSVQRDGGLDKYAKEFEDKVLPRLPRRGQKNAVFPVV